MATPMYDLQPMSIGDILDRTVRLYRQGFLHNFVIVALPYILFIPMAAVFGSSLLGGRDPQMLFRPGVIGLLALLGVGFVWLTFVSMGALARSVSERYLGETPTVAGSYGAVLRRTLSLIWAYLLAFLVWGGIGILAALLIGAMMFMSPIAGVVSAVVIGLIALVAFVRFLLITQVIVIEDIRGVAALQRSWSLMRGNFWRAVLIFVFAIVVSIVMSLVLSIPGGIVAGLIGGTVGAIISQVFSQLSQILLTPVFAIAITLLYYDSRIRNEAFDLEVMAQNLGVATGGPNLAPAEWEAGPPPAEGPVPPPAAPLHPLPVARQSSPPSSGPAATSAARPPRPAAAPGAAPRPVGAFKTCPKCKAQVPAIKPNCPKCGTRVLYRAAR
jgi:hypothetical protein